MLEKFKVRLAKVSELREVAGIYTTMYPGQTAEEMEQWVKSEKFPFRQHFIVEMNGKIAGAITWEIYDNYQERIVIEIKWLAIRQEFQGAGLGGYLILESFESFNRSWKNRVVTVRVAPYSEKQRLDTWYKRVLDGLSGPEAQIIPIPNLFGKGKSGENVVIKNLR